MLKPTENYVMIQRLDTPTTTPSGLVLTQESKESPNKGIVLAIGPGSYQELILIPVRNAKINDIVYFTKFAGNEIEEQGKKYLFLKDSDILAIDSNE